MLCSGLISAITKNNKYLCYLVITSNNSIICSNFHLFNTLSCSQITKEKLQQLDGCLWTQKERRKTRQRRVFLCVKSATKRSHQTNHYSGICRYILDSSVIIAKFAEEDLTVIQTIKYIWDLTRVWSIIVSIVESHL